MEFYETTYILHPALQEGRLNDIIKTIQKKAEALGAEILYFDNWGRKKLAYLIDKEKYGTYIFLQYKLSELSNLKELSSEFEHNPNVLRYLNIKIDKEDVFKTTKEETKEAVVEETKVEETKVEETKVEETKVEETKVEETKVEETEVEETKVEETKVEETKVEETKVEETKVEETKVEETKVEETKVEETEVEETKAKKN